LEEWNSRKFGKTNYSDGREYLGEYKNGEENRIW
jgi:hypothetical protein